MDNYLPCKLRCLEVTRHHTHESPCLVWSTKGQIGIGFASGPTEKDCLPPMTEKRNANKSLVNACREGEGGGRCGRQERHMLTTHMSTSVHFLLRS